MKSLSIVLAGAAVVLLAACNPISKTAQEELAQPVNCRTAEGDIRILESEKAHAAKQAASGISAVTPAGLVVGVVTGTEDEKIEVATGEYNRRIDRKIAEIKETCGL